VIDKEKRTLVEEQLFSDWISRREEWIESFSSIFSLLCNKKCQYFYCCFKTFTTIFTGPGIAGNSTFRAILTRSTKKFRESLDTAEVKYTMPLFKLDKGQVDKSISKELEDLEKKCPGQTKTITKEALLDDKPETLLLFEGSKNINGLYDFLSKMAAEKNNEHPSFFIPVIYSPVSFLNSALKKLKYRSQKVAKPNNEGKDLETEYNLEIQGPILPDTAFRLCNLMPLTQNTDFSVFFDSNTDTYNFNKVISNLMEPKPSGTDETINQNCTPKEFLQTCNLSGTIRKINYTQKQFQCEIDS
jgi:hypothetical protein